MRLKILDKEALAPLVNALMADYQVVGPQAKGHQFTFGPIVHPAELRLDYNTTILPPSKAVLQPPLERLAAFRLGEDLSVEPVVEAVPTVLMGVHICDLYAIRLLDQVFSKDYSDANYLERRQHTAIVSLECLRPCDEHSFCKDMGTLPVDDFVDRPIDPDVLLEKVRALIEQAQ